MGIRTDDVAVADGYAVVDVETTGLRPSWSDRVIEIGVVHLDPAGRATGEWATLINPERDLGPQHVHRIEAADLRYAPTFGQIAGDLVELLRGRVMVAHNLPFDAGFLASEFTRLGVYAPVSGMSDVCTMRWAGRLLPGAPRSLAGCCAMSGIPLDGHHSALVDARAGAALLAVLMSLSRPTTPWKQAVRKATALTWPALPPGRTDWVPRGVAKTRDRHFLARITDRLPRVTEPAGAEPYLALLDRALLDRHISATEGDALVDAAAELGLDRHAVEGLHRGYLDALARAAWDDGIVTDDERADLHAVADLLGLSVDDADQALTTAQDAPAGTDHGVQRRSQFVLAPGDLVVFTGEMDEDREVWEDRARAAGLQPHAGVTKKVRLVVAADPDSMSGKAKKARQYGIPIITPDAFAGMIASIDATAR